MCWNTYFIVFFSNINQNLAQKGAKKKTITFHILQNTGYLKKTVLLQLPFWPKIDVFQLAFFNQKHWCWTKNITEYHEKIKIRKSDLKEKTRQETKTTQDWWKQIAIEYFDVVSFQEQNQRRQKKKEREKKEGTKRKQKRKTRRKKERKEQEKERERER